MSIYNAIESNDVELLQSLLQLGVVRDLNRPTECQNTPLYLIVALNADRILRFLYLRGIDISAFCDKQKFGNAIFHAIHHERIQIIRLLYILGIDLDAACDRFGHTPEKAAEIMGKPHIARMILELKKAKDEAAVKIQKIARGMLVRRAMEGNNGGVSKGGEGGGGALAGHPDDGYPISAAEEVSLTE